MNSANTFGNRFSFMTFGESHGEALGVVIDGCPAGVPFDLDLLLENLRRRRPGGVLDSARTELDEPKILSGIFEGKTLGTPIAILVTNTDTRSQDYNKMIPRSGHADDVWKSKFGHVDPRGGGRASGRETVSRVIAGSVAEMLLKEVYPQIRVFGFTKNIGPLNLEFREECNFLDKIQIFGNATQVRGHIDKYPARLPSDTLFSEVELLLKNAKEAGESYGGAVEIRVVRLGRGLGQPVFRKLKAELTSALMGVGATAAVEIGTASKSQSKVGSEFHQDSKNYGGIRGGISTGEDIVLSVTFKPPSTIGTNAKSGRHDPFVASRAIPVLEAMVTAVLADQVLWAATDKIENLKRLNL